MKRRILLIDFEPRSLQSTRLLLERSGFVVACARTGQEATVALREGQTDLVILEPMIPGQDGFKLVAAIKKGEFGSRPKVIIASRIFRGPRYRSLSRDSGADAYLERPQQDNILTSAAEKLVPPQTPVHGAPPTITLPSQIVPRAETAPPRRSAAVVSVLQPVSANDAQPFSSMSDNDIEDALSRVLDHGQEDAVDAVFAVGVAEAPARRANVAAGAFANAPSAGIATLVAEAPLGGGGWQPPAGRGAPAPWDVETASPERILETDDLGGLSEDLVSALDRLDLDRSAHVEVGLQPAPIIFDDKAATDLDRFTADLSQGVDEPVDFDLLPPLEADVMDVAPPTTGGEARRESYTGGQARGISGTAGSLPEKDDGAAGAHGPTLDAELDQLFGSRSGSVEAPEPPEIPAAGQAVSQFAERARSGPVGRSPEARPGAPPTDSSVPDKLRGMDARTADLLSSIEELESSVADLSGFAGDTGWTGNAEVREQAGERAGGAANPDDCLEQVISRVEAVESEPRELVEPSSPGGLELEPLAGPLYSDPNLEKEWKQRSRGAPSRPLRESAGERSEGSQKWSRWWGWLFSLLAVLAAVAGVVTGIKYFAIGSGGASAPSSSGHKAIEDLPPAEVSPPPPPARTEAAAEEKTKSTDMTVAPAKPRASVRARPGAGALASAATEARQRRARAQTRIANLPTPAAEIHPATQAARPAPVETAGAAPAPEAGEPPVVITPAARPTPEPAVARPGGNAEPDAPPPPPAETFPSVAPPSENPDQAAPAPAPAEPPPLVRISELDAPLERLFAPPPPLPPEARDAGVEGRVFVNVLIGADGTVKEERVIVEPGYGLGRAAREAISGWRYSPPQRARQPVRVWKTEVVEFRKSEPSGRPEP